jgi:hypothetical protein
MPARRLLAMLLFAVSCLGSWRDAHAEEEGAERGDGKVARTRFIGRVDALGLLGGRFGVEVEYLATPQDGFGAYPFVVLGSIGGTPSLIESDPSFTYETWTSGAGLDLQYRHYTGSRAPGRGFFFAPGVEAQYFVTDTAQRCASSYSYNNPGAECPSSLPSVHQVFGYVGPSLDLGWQVIFAGGFVLSVSLGGHYRALLGSLDTNEMPWLWTALNGPGLRPRLRVEFGWSFP